MNCFVTQLRQVTMSQRLVSQSEIIECELVPSENQDRLSQHWEVTQEAMGRWLAGKKKSTAGTYRTAIKQFFSYCQNPLEAITVEDIENWMWSLENQYKISTQRGKVSAVKSFFSFCTKRDYLSVNLGAKVDMTNKAKDQLAEKLLTESEVKAIIDSADNERDRILLKFLYATGVRVTELVNLKWSDLTPNAGAGQAVILGKGDKTRVVLIPSSVWLELMTLPRPCEYVFINYKGDPISRVSVHRLIKKSVKRSGIDKPVSAHWFRHSHATIAIERGCNLHLLQQSLGHSSLDITTKYLHARPNQGSSQFIEL